MSLLNNLKQLDNASGASKEVLLASMPELTPVLKYALDPFYTYGLQDLPHVPLDAVQLVPFDEIAYPMLDALRLREVTGHAARSLYVETAAMLNPDDRELLRRVVLKDLRCGVGLGTVRKIYPELVKEFQVQLAEPYSERRVVFPALGSPKVDGMRALAVYCARTNSVTMFTRTGRVITTTAQVEEAIVQHFPPGVVLDGELSGASFLDTISAVRRKEGEASVRFYIFDLLTQSEFESKGVRESFGDPQLLRLARLRALMESVPESSPLTLLEHIVLESHEQTISLYNHYRSLGLEGLMVKNAKASYTKARSRNWMKLKAEESDEFAVIGYERGTGKYADALGALIVDVKGLAVSVGSGFTDEQRVELWAMRERGIIGRLAEIEYHEITAHGSLRHPRFIRFRDKDGDKC